MSKKKSKNTKNNSLAEKYKQNYKKLLIIPIIMLLFGIVMIANTISKDGAPIYRDVSLKGGLNAIVEIDSQMTNEQLQQKLEETYNNDFTVSRIKENNQFTGYTIETDLEETELIKFLEETFQIPIKQGENYTSNYISPSLSNSFFYQAMIVLLISFVLMSAVIFIYFRKLVPSFAVILSAIFDIIVTIGILNLIEFKVSIAGIGALLMLIGYSIDTDVLLTNRLIKEKGENYYKKTFQAFKTGTLMSFTTFVAGLSALILTNSAIIYEIALILVIGLLVDYISTWIQNTSLLLWWIEKTNP